MTDKIEATEVRLPTLMLNFETDADLDQYVIDHAHMFTVIQIRPGGFVGGHDSNYIREEILVEDGDRVDALKRANDRAAEIYGETKKSLLIYAVADFAGANGFSRPVQQYPVSTYKSKADKKRDEIREKRLAREAKKKA